MPMCDIYIQQGALEAAAEAELVAKVSHLLSGHEVRSIRELGVGDDVEARVERAESIAWMFVHRADTYVAGRAVGPETPRGPVYKFEVKVPEGLIDDDYLTGINRDILQALTEAEAGRWPHPESRLWVIVGEVPDGLWGSAGRPFPLRAIVEYVAPGWGEHAVQRRERRAAGLVAAAAPSGAGHSG